MTVLDTQAAAVVVRKRYGTLGVIDEGGTAIRKGLGLRINFLAGHF